LQVFGNGLSMSSLGLLSLLFLGFALGLRHGIDWDHIAAITDITGSVVTTDEAEELSALDTPGIYTSGGFPAQITLTKPMARRKVRREFREGFFLATMYALGHASLVVVLGLLALWLGAILPDWLDPIMERLVGVTLLILGVWIFYSIWRYGRSFQLKSRWMLVFSLVGRTWEAIRSKITGRPIKHSHDAMRYGPKTAFGIGLIHGVGAETGSQAVLLATAAGATTKLTASLLLLTFTIGLLLSNSLVAAFSLTGFVSASVRRNVYVVAGALAGVFSLFVGFFFVTGLGTDLPDLQELLNKLFGASKIRL
jgi:cytochrome c biogenesis protein CcdA